MFDNNKVECMAEWLRHWTQDLGVLGSIPAMPIMCEIHGQALNPHCFCPLSNNGYQVEWKLVLCEWLQLKKIAMHSPQVNDSVWKRWVQMSGDNSWKVWWTYWDILTINTHLYLYLYCILLSSLCIVYGYRDQPLGHWAGAAVTAGMCCAVPEQGAVHQPDQTAGRPNTAGHRQLYTEGKQIGKTVYID